MTKGTKKSKEYEPTLLDVLQAVQTGFGKAEERFEQVDVRFDKMDERFDKMDERFDKMDERFDKLEKRTGSIENTLEDMKGTLNSIERAVDKDAVTVIDHGRRIVHLEKISAVPV